MAAGSARQTTTDAYDESALLVAAQAGDAEAFGELYDLHCPLVYRYALSKTASSWVAEDLTSATFLKALHSLATFTPGSNFPAWLITIARNLITDHYRSSWSRLAVVTEQVEPPPDQKPGPEQKAIAALTSEALHAAVDQLPADQRECLLLRFASGLSIRETAETLGRTEGAIKQLQWRGTRQLRSLIRGQTIFTEP